MLLIKISDTIFFIFQTLLKKAASKSYKKRRPIGVHSLVFLDKVAPTRNLAIGGDVKVLWVTLALKLNVQLKLNVALVGLKLNVLLKLSVTLKPPKLNVKLKPNVVQKRGTDRKILSPKWRPISQVKAKLEIKFQPI